MTEVTPRKGQNVREWHVGDFVAVLGAGTIGACLGGAVLGVRTCGDRVRPRPRRDHGAVDHREHGGDAPPRWAYPPTTSPPGCGSPLSSRKRSRMPTSSRRTVPENPEFKQQLWPRVEQAVRPTTLLLSSTSGITATLMGVDMKDPGRVVVGHPFNPPHLVPLVEVVPSPSTPLALVDEVVAFYTRGREAPARCPQRIPGFVANRLQMACSASTSTSSPRASSTQHDLDEVVTSSIGLRWASRAVPDVPPRRRAGRLRRVPRQVQPPNPRAVVRDSGHLSSTSQPSRSSRTSWPGATDQIPMVELESRRDHQQVAVIRALGIAPDPSLTPAHAGHTTYDDLVGTWKLVRWENVVDGEPQNSVLGESIHRGRSSTRQIGTCPRS